MTFSILARCPRTGRLGLGITSYTVCVGLYANGVRANVGATMTQSSIRERNNGLVLNLLAMGHSGGQVLELLKVDDPDWDYRQIGIVDRVGNVVAYSGPKGRATCVHRIGQQYVALGNGIVSQAVTDAMAGAFERNPEAELEERLLCALEAGRDAGGQRSDFPGKKAERSAAITVFSSHDYPDFDLRVDFHHAAVDELRRIHEDYKPYRAYYAERFGNRQKVMMAPEEFERQLKAKKAA